MGRKGVKTLSFILLIFAATYMGLMGAYQLGNWASILAGTIFLGIGIWLIKAASRSAQSGASNTRKYNYYGIFAGIFLWAFIGEVMEHLGVVKIASWYMWPILILITFVTILVIVKQYLPHGLMFAGGTFNAIWFLHFVMINQYELLGRNHWITYPSCIMLLIAAILFGFKMTRAQTTSENMAYALALLLTGWSVLEYIWGWRLIPGPWMLHE